MLYPILISYKYTYISHCELSHLHPLYVIHSFSAFCFFTQKNKGNFFFLFSIFSNWKLSCWRLVFSLIVSGSDSSSSLSLLLEDSISFNFQFFFSLRFSYLSIILCAPCVCWKACCGGLCSSCTSQSLCKFFVWTLSLCCRFSPRLLFIEVMQILLSCFYLLGLGSAGVICVQFGGLEILLVFRAFVNSLRLDLLHAVFFCSNVKVGFLRFSICVSLKASCFLVFLCWFYFLGMKRSRDDAYMSSQHKRPMVSSRGEP